jgi:uncharacterized protein YutE (UPF0331/DUF86 family)
VVDETRVALLLQRVTDELAYLRARAEGDRRALLSDDERLSGLKYRFVTAIEGVVNVAQHLCAAEGWGPPRDNGDAVRTIARHGVLPVDLGDRLARAVGFRNVLVHRYAEVDDRLVVAQLDEIADLDDFVAAVSAWLLGDQAGEP